MGRKRLLIAIVLSIVMIVLLYPLYSAGNMLQSYADVKQHKFFRIDIFNGGGSENKVRLLKNSSNVQFRSPGWFQNPKWMKVKGNGSVADGALKAKWQDYYLQVKAVGSGELSILLRGLDRKINNKRYPVPVDYKKLTVNGKTVFWGKKVLWHDKPFVYKQKVKDGDVLNIVVTARRHHFGFSDLQEVYGFNFKMLLTVGVLSFLLSYKMVQYAARFKILEHNSRIDIVFLCVFFVLLFIPMLKINPAEKSVQENRMLAKYPSVFGKNGLNVKFGEQFDAWFNDRFNFREFVIKLFYNLKFFDTYAENNYAIYNKKDNWFFTKRWNSVSMYQQRYLFSLEQLEKILSNFEQIQAWCDKNGIKFYVMLSNDKESLYGKYYPQYYKKVHKISQREQLVEFLRKNSDINIIEATDELKESIKHGDDVFCRTGTHMNTWGSYLEYKQLVSEFVKDFPDLPQLEERDFEISKSSVCDTDILRSMNLSGYDAGKNLYKHIKIKDFESKFIWYEDLYPQNLRAEKGHSGRSFYKNKNGKYKIFVVGDSFVGGYVNLLSYNFRELYRLYLQIPNDRTKLEIIFPKDQEFLYENKPDILLIESTERFLYRFLDMKIIPE